MEDPTPVSALLHSATMVGASFYLLLKLGDFFLIPSSGLNIIGSLILIVALLTIILSSYTAYSIYNIKGILANSTASQLDFMLLAYSCANTAYAYLHFFSHTIFKAFLFLLVEYLIHVYGDEQNSRSALMVSMQGGHTVRNLFLIGILSLGGIAGFIGFYSKDGIIISIIAHGNSNFFMFFLLCFTMILTCSYSYNLIAATICSHHVLLKPARTKFSSELLILIILGISSLYFSFFFVYFQEYFSLCYLFSTNNSHYNTANSNFNYSLMSSRKWISVLLLTTPLTFFLLYNFKKNSLDELKFKFNNTRNALKNNINLDTILNRWIMVIRRFSAITYKIFNFALVLQFLHSINIQIFYFFAMSSSKFGMRFLFVTCTLWALVFFFSWIIT